MDQKALDDAYDQDVYAPNRPLIVTRRVAASEHPVFEPDARHGNSIREITQKLEKSRNTRRRYARGEELTDHCDSHQLNFDLRGS